MDSQRTGMTLVEMLLVMAIIGVLVALLLPAVQSAREAARRMSCSNNLRQIGLAVSSYESVHKAYPPGARWGRHAPVGKRKRRGSILVHLLPYLEQNAAYDAFDFKKKEIDDQVFPGTNRLIASHPISTYVCPSDGHGGSFNGRALHNYAASRGPTEVWDNPQCSCTHPWKELARAPIDDLVMFAGPFTRVGVSSHVRDITDGTSKTIFFGEVRPECSVHAQAGWAKTNNGSGYCTTMIPINYDTCNEEAPDPCNRPCTWNTDVGFKSPHPGGSQFLFGDVSMRFIQESVDHQLYQLIGTKDDGEVFDGGY